MVVAEGAGAHRHAEAACALTAHDIVGDTIAHNSDSIERDTEILCGGDEEGRAGLSHQHRLSFARVLEGGDEGARVEAQSPTRVPESVFLDRNQFQSVFLNIIINALDATEPGGSINVDTGISLSASDSGKKAVEITIADTGCGIPPENLDKLFDPFFTTKEVGQGTGLGLSVSYGVVQRHGGTIRVQSEVGKGTRFFIWLPIEGEG